MSKRRPDWRVYPGGIPVVVLTRYGDDAAVNEKWVDAGNWYLHAINRGSRRGREKLLTLKPLLEDMAVEGDMHAKVLVAQLYLLEGGDAEVAATLLEEAANAGVVEGLREFGRVLDHGIGVPEDSERANLLFGKAAERGDGDASFYLAMNFYQGRGTDVNYGEFIKWIFVAGDMGVPKACAMIGDMYSEKRDPVTALQWYVGAALSSHVPSMLRSAELFRNGEGGSVDRVQALRWFLAPLNFGNGDGVHYAINLAKSMTEEEIREAGRLSGRPDDAESFIGRS